MTTSDMIHFKDWEKLDLRVGKILKVENHPKADKLYVLTVDFGEEIGTRTIVAGLKEYCKPSHLKNKSAIFIVNLEPRELRGIESQGMILAAIGHKGGGHHHTPKACIITPDEEMEPGSEVS